MTDVLDRARIASADAAYPEGKYDKRDQESDRARYLAEQEQRNSSLVRALIATISGPARDWVAQAACRDADLDLFYGSDHIHPRDAKVRFDQAKAICRECPVRIECLDYALANYDRHGIWGGMGPKARERLQKERR